MCLRSCIVHASLSDVALSFLVNGEILQTVFTGLTTGYCRWCKPFMMSVFRMLKSYWCDVKIMRLRIGMQNVSTKTAMQNFKRLHLL